jgi:RNA polymerase sigma factor (sigma-70 family)
MTCGPLTDVLRHIRRLAIGADVRGLEDRQLLERFLNRQDERAFEALVSRHGPLVLGVCRRFLTDALDIEDAFQATFLVLLRKARSLRRRELLAGWLCGVAYRTALRARAAAANRRIHERRASRDRSVAQDDGLGRLDAGPALDEEIRRLPAKYRLPVVLCYLEGLTLVEASRQLGWPAGTVSGRLARARDLLRARLTRRGISLAGAGIGVMAPASSRAVPVHLASSTVRVVAAMAAKQAAAGGIASAHVLMLTEGVLRTMLLTKLKIVAGAAVAIASLGTATGVVLYGRSVADGPDTPRAKAQVVSLQQPVPPPEEHGRDLEKGLAQLLNEPDGMPDISPRRVKTVLAGAKADDRIKSLLKAQFEAASGEAHARWREFMAGRGFLAFFISSSERLFVAESDLSDRPADHVAALENHWKRMREIEKVNEERFNDGRIAIQDVLACRSYRLQAEIRLERARSERKKESRK